MAEKFDAIVVGAGPAGNAAAYVMAKQGLKVLQIERGEYSGAKNVQGAIMYSDALEKIIPDFRNDLTLERHIVEQRVWLMSDDGHIGTNYRSEAFNSDKPNRYTIIRVNLDKWFSQKVREAGALVICETTVNDLIIENGVVKGVRCDRENGDVYADVVVLADGVNSMLARKAGFRAELKTEEVALAVKEIHFMDEEVINQRFGITGNEGVVIEMMGKVTEGMIGTAFLYTNKASLTIGIGCMISDFKKLGMQGKPVPPYKLLEDLKKHPSVKPMIAGGEPKEYCAHMIPEGGYKAIPKLYGQGWMVVGDAAQLNNAVHREGSNLAMTSGRLAAETVVELNKAGKPMTEGNLALYRKKLDDSFIMKDLKKYQHAPEILHGAPHFLVDYPELMTQAAYHWFTVDDHDKKTKQKEIMKSFMARRSMFGLVKDAYKFVRAFR